MNNYHSYSFTDDENFIEAFDEAPLWSAAFGLFLLKHLELKPGITVADIGSGTGFPLFELAGRMGPGCTLYGIDPWTQAYHRAQKKLKQYGYTNVTLIDSSATHIPLPDETVHLVVSNLGINNFDDPLAAMKECFRLLKPGGTIAITSNLNGHWKLFYSLFTETIKELKLNSIIDKVEQQQDHRGNVKTINTLFENAGFLPVRHVEENMEMKFVDGSAFLRHHFVQCGWLGSWFALVPESERKVVFSNLEERLNHHSLHSGGLSLSVPMAYIEGKKS